MAGVTALRKNNGKVRGGRRGLRGKEDSGMEDGEVGFVGLLLMFRTGAAIGLGEIPDPLSKERKIDLSSVRQVISSLEMLEKKTKGNLTLGEERELGEILFELRMKYLDQLKGRQSAQASCGEAPEN